MGLCVAYKSQQYGLSLRLAEKSEGSGLVLCAANRSGELRGGLLGYM